MEATLYEGGATQRSKKVSKFNLIEQKKDLKRFKRKLGSIGLIVKQVGGDGNCLFRSIADQLDGDQSKQEQYREDAVKYIRENPEYFEPFIRGDPKYEESKTPIEDYCAQMSKSTTWGGQMEINALAKSHKFNVFLHQVGQPSLVHVFHEPMGSVPTVHISYHRGRHYNSVRRADDTMKSKEAPIVHFPIGHDPKNLGTPIQKLTQAQVRRIELESNQVFNEAFYDNLTDTIDKCLGWMLPNKALTRATVEQCHLTFVAIDDKQNHLQKMIGLVETSDESSDEGEDNGEPKIDEKSLKQKLEVLTKDDEYIVDIPDHCELHNLKYKQRPKSDSTCACGSTNKYQECCMKIDKDQKQKIIEEIEQYFEQKHKDLHEVVYV